ncbi:hypothetical protein [Halorhodospira sp. 9622]|uniref:hypothetical protein n=1 Tax=Halorhodospira sp. 9622 TaxID=2899136 RepID=UPI001EE8938B|nr:hypothetical protein [Halorhodospira sp. 9622]MCG5539477.1 hypothetical protein [Halorhodospira sp. 9622]
MRAAGSLIAMLCGVLGTVGMGALLLFEGAETYKAGAFLVFEDVQSALYAAIAGALLSLAVAVTGFACLKIGHRGLGVVLLMLALGAAVLGGPLIALAMLPVCIAGGFVMTDRGKPDHRYRGLSMEQISGIARPRRLRDTFAEVMTGEHIRTRGP